MKAPVLKEPLLHAEPRRLRTPEDPPGGEFRWWRYRRKIERAIRRGQFGAARKLLDWWWPRTPTMLPSLQREFCRVAVNSIAHRMELQVRYSPAWVAVPLTATVDVVLPTMIEEVGVNGHVRLDNDKIQGTEETEV